jgi:23S rRNA pseudouridine1911/1915/1917 synthase
LKYGAKRSNPDASISLQAQKIIFEHPVGKKMIKVETPFPLFTN